MDADFRRRQELLAKSSAPTIPAVWLRPTIKADAGLTASKLGGKIAWPKTTKWPKCDGGDEVYEHVPGRNDNYVPLAQFRKDDFPEINFPEESDILQLLWCPRLHMDAHNEDWVDGPKMKAFWHSVGQLEDLGNPKPRCPDPGLVPRECIFDPLRLDDTVMWVHLTESQRSKAVGPLAEEQYSGSLEWVPDEAVPALQWGETAGPIPGTKLLGYLNYGFHSLLEQNVPECNGGHRMSHLFTLTSGEIDPGEGKWYIRQRYRGGGEPLESWLRALVGVFHVFYCDKCQDHPVSTVLIQG